MENNNNFVTANSGVTVREVFGLLSNARKICLSYGEHIVDDDANLSDPLTMAAYGDFIVSSISGYDENGLDDKECCGIIYEINLAYLPLKRG